MTNREIRRKAFNFLFEEYVKGKECDWSKDRRHLKEVVVFEIDPAKASKNNSIELPKGSGRVVGFFDQIVVRGKNLEFINSPTIRIGSKHFRTKRVKKASGEYFFAVPPLPLPKNAEAKRMELFLGKADKMQVTQVAFRNEKLLGKKFDEYARQSSVYKTKEGDLFDEAQLTFIEKINESRVEVLASSLRDNTEEFARIIVPAQMTAGLDIISINGLLADRRVSRLYEAMSQMSASEASRFASSSFDKEFSRFKSDWENSDILPVRKLYAVESLLFLSSEFCTPRTFIKKLDKWQDWYDENVDKKNFQFKGQGRADPLLVASLYANIIARQRGLSLEESNEWLQQIISPLLSKESSSPKLVQRWLASSDWTPSRIDLVADVPTFQAYHSWQNKKIQTRILKRLRSEID